MANRKATMTDLRMIIREFAKGTPMREIERKLNLSRTSLRTYKERAGRSGDGKEEDGHPPDGWGRVRGPHRTTGTAPHGKEDDGRLQGQRSCPGLRPDIRRCGDTCRGHDRGRDHEGGERHPRRVRDGRPGRH